MIRIGYVFTKAVPVGTAFAVSAITSSNKAAGPGAKLCTASVLIF